MNYTARPYANYVSDSAAGFIILFSLLGIIGNTLTIIAFKKSKKIQKNATKTFIINLAISDLILSAVSLPILAGQFLFDSWLFDRTLCRVSSFILFGNINVSLLSMTAIAITRYFMILKPTDYSRRFTDKNICISLIIIWTLSYLERVPTTFDLWGTVNINSKTLICGSCSCNQEEDSLFKPNIILSIIAFIIPCLVMSYSYIWIYWKIKSTRKNFEKHNTSNLKRNISYDDKIIIKKIDDEKKVTKIMFIIFVSFLLCFLPMIIVLTIDDEEKYPEFHILYTTLNCAIVFINPFIYAFTNKRYRNAYKEIFKSSNTTVSNQQDISLQVPRSLP